MKRRRKEIKNTFFSIFLGLLLCVGPISASAEEILYQAYNEPIGLSSGLDTTGIRIKDGTGKDGKDNIAYCYDLQSNFPSSEESADKTLYTKIENYLDSDDLFTEQYGKEKKERIAAILNAGYPNDSYGYMEKYGISEDDARYMTQNLIWDITNENEGDYVEEDGKITYLMAEYANELLKVSRTSKFVQGKLSLEGNLEFTYRGDSWTTDKLSIVGDRGELRFKELPSDIEIIDWNTDKKITGNLSVGQEFYIKSVDEPLPDTKFKLEYQYNAVKFYFYKYQSGGNAVDGKSIQNLVRSEPTNELVEVLLEIKINGDFNEIIVGESGDETWTEDTAESIGGSIPDGTIIGTEEESGSGIVEIDSNTAESIGGSIPDGTIIETEEESGSGIVETDSNTAEGIGGSIPDETIIETEKESGSRIVKTNSNTAEGMERSSPDCVPKTGDDSNIWLWAALCGISLISFLALFIVRFRKR